MKNMKSYKKVIGIAAIILGFIALITPFTPGATWLIFIGLQMIGLHFAFLDKIDKKIKDKLSNKKNSKSKEP